MQEQQQAQTTVERGIGVATFDRVHGGLQHANAFKSTKPSTVVETMPIIGDRTVYIVQSFKTDAHGFVISLEIVDAQGPVRVIIPNRAALAIYRQRQSLTDRSTPSSRKRKQASRERAKTKAARERRRAPKATTNG